MLPPDKMKIVDYDEAWAAQNMKPVLDRMQTIIVKTQN